MHACTTGDLPFGKTVCPVWSVEDLDNFGGAVVWVWLVLCEDERWLVLLDFDLAMTGPIASATERTAATSGIVIRA